MPGHSLHIVYNNMELETVFFIQGWNFISKVVVDGTPPWHKFNIRPTTYEHFMEKTDIKDKLQSQHFSEVCILYILGTLLPTATSWIKWKIFLFPRKALTCRNCRQFGKLQTKNRSVWVWFCHEHDDWRLEGTDSGTQKSPTSKFQFFLGFWPLHFGNVKKKLNMCHEKRRWNNTIYRKLLPLIFWMGGTEKPAKPFDLAFDH